jgi:O-antigen ligase
MNSEIQAQRKPTLAARLLPWTAVILLAGHISGAMACLYDHGQMPLKPRDFTLGLVAVNLFLVMFNRPSFRPATLLLLLIPTLRLLDSGVLKRYINYGLGDHSIAVMILANVWLVTVVAMCMLATENWRAVALRAAIAVIILDSGSVLYEALGMATYSQIGGRYAGFLTQPNDSIIILCLMLGIVLTLSDRFWLNAAIIAIGAVGVGLTLSRSGMLVFIAMVGLWLVLNLRRHFGKIALLVAASVPAIAVGIAVLTQMASSRNFGTDKNAKERIEAIFGGNTDKMESAERMKDLNDAWEAVTESPIVGHGTGSASSFWQPHNQWVGIWLDLGVGGVLLFASVLIFLSARCAMTKGKGVLAIMPLWMFTVFSQNLVEMAGYWFCAGVAMNMVTSGRFRITLRRSSPAPASTALPAH